jgi:hypothetical protein
MRLAVEDIELGENFKREFEKLGFALPLTIKDGATLADVRGKRVAVVDFLRDLGDDEALAVASLIQLAVNTCGGFKAALEWKDAA